MLVGIAVFIGAAVWGSRSTEPVEAPPMTPPLYTWGESEVPDPPSLRSDPYPGGVVVLVPAAIPES